VTKSLYVNGDSWSWDPDIKSPTLWTNIVASKLSMSCTNEAMGCGSNSRIFDNLQDLFATEEKPDLIIIALTSHHRHHIPFKNFGAWTIGPDTALNDQTGDKNDVIRDWYFKYAFEDLSSMYRYYRTIWLMNMLAKQHRCPIWLFQAWDTDIENFGLMNSLENIKNYVGQTHPVHSYYYKKYVRGFDFFRQESKKWNYVETAFAKIIPPDCLDQTGHPAPDGHSIIADIVLNHIMKEI